MKKEREIKKNSENVGIYNNTNRNVVLFNSKTHLFLLFLSFFPIHRNNSSLLKPFFLITTKTETPFPQTLESPQTDPHRSQSNSQQFLSIRNTVDHTHPSFYP